MLKTKGVRYRADNSVDVSFSSKSGPVQQEFDALSNLAKKYEVKLTTKRMPAIPRGKGTIVEIVLGLPIDGNYKENPIDLSTVSASDLHKRFQNP